MEVQPELSLGPTSLGFAAMKSPRNSSSDSEGSGGGAAGKKRKHFAWEEAVSHGSGLDLQLGDPLPLDWEQCLDLHVREHTELQTHTYIFFIYVPGCL